MTQSRRRSRLLFAAFSCVAAAVGFSSMWATAATDPMGPHSVASLSANAGPDQLATIGQTIRLDGSASTSRAANSDMRYQWQLTTPAGSGAALSDPTAPRPTFVVDLVGDYVATLIATDDTTKAQTELRVSTGNVAPIARINPDLAFAMGDVVVLDGLASTDANGDNLSYTWTLLQTPQGSQASLDAADTPTPYFMADAAGDYLIELRTHDGRSSSRPVQQWFSSINSAPIADAGKARVIAPGQTVTLSGAASIDPQRDALDYQWRVLHAPLKQAFSLSDANTPTPMFSAQVPGDYVVQLAVRDGSALPAALATTVVSVIERAALPVTQQARGGLDSDGDGVPDDIDNCVDNFNPSQLDTNGDGFGNRCDADLDNDGFITNFGDLGLLRLAFFSSPGAANWNPDADFNEDNVINFADLGIMRTFFFGPPGPVALTFINPNGGSWHDPANWSPPVIPNTTHTVRIDLDPASTVEYSTGSSEIAGLVATSPVSITGGVLSVAGNAQFNAGLIIDNATLATANVLPPNDPAAAQLVTAGTVTLDNVDLGMDMLVPQLTNVTILGGMTLDGSRITLSTDGSFSVLNFGGALGATSTLDGFGEVRFAGTTTSSSVNDVRIASGHNLIIGEDITLRTETTGGRVRSTSTSGSLIFNGTLVSDVAERSVTLLGAPLVIDGVVNVSNDATFIGDFNGAGSRVTSNALIDVVDSEIELFGIFEHQGMTTLANSTLDIGNNGTENWRNTGSFDVFNSTIELGGFFTAADAGVFTGSGTMLINGTLDNTDVALDIGTLFTDTVEFGGSGTLIGGSLVTTTVPVVSSFTFDGVTLGADTVVGGQVVLTLRNGLTLDNSTISLNSSGNISALSFAGAANETSVFGGTGTLSFEGVTTSSLLNEIRIASANHSLLIDTGIAIDTATTGGRIRGLSGSTGITLNGSIVSNISGRDVTISGSPLTINGTLDASNGGRIIADFLTVDSRIAPSAVLTANGGELELLGTFVNQGTINVTDGILDIGNNATEIWSNAGTININNATVELGGRFTIADAGSFTGTGTLLLNGTFDNVGGSVDLGALFSGSLTLGGNGTVLGGSIINSPITIASNFTFDGVTLAADATLVNGTNLTIVNDLMLDEAVISIESIGSFTALSFTGPNGDTSTLGGTGEIRFAGTTPSSTVSEIRAASTNNALVIDSGIRVISDTTGGRIRALSNSTTVTLNGAIESSVAGRTISIAGAALNVSGTLMATNGAKITADFTTAGVIDAAAIINATGANSEIELLGFITNNADINITDGILDIGNNTNEEWVNNGSINLNNATAELGGTFTTADIGTVTGTGTVLIDGLLDNTGENLDVSTLFGGIVNFGGTGTLLGGSLITTPVTVVSGFVLDGLTLATDLNLDSGATVTVNNGLTLNNGNVIINSVGNFTALSFAGGNGETSTFGGTGEVRFNGTTPSSAVSELRTTGTGHTLLVDSGITVRSVTTGGRIRTTGSNAAIVFNGNIVSDVDNRSITLTAGNTLTIGGTFSATNGATIMADFPAGSSITSSANLSADGGEIGLVGLFSNAGTIDIANGTLDIGNNNAEAWSNTGTITLTNSTIELGGLIVLADIGTIGGTGTMLVDGNIENTGQSLDLGTIFSGAITLGNNGAIDGGTLINTPVTVASVFNFNEGVTLDVDLSMSDGSRLNIGGGLTLNNVDISMESDGNFTFMDFKGSTGEAVSLAGTGEILFAGTTTSSNVTEVRGSDSVNFTIDSGITLRTVTTGGRIRSVSGNSPITLNGNVVSDVAGRSVTLTSPTLLIQGTLDTRIGALTALGNVTLGSSAVLNAEIGGTTTATIGRYSGSATTLAGTLNATLGNGYTPLLAETYPLFTFASNSSGTFDTVNVPTLGGGLSLTPVYNATDFSLEVTN